MANKKPIMVIGHRNPDTDSICSAIAYANLKNQISCSENYLPMRCGEISPETQFVLDRFQVATPTWIDNVRTQVCDIEIKQVDAVSGGMSIKRAYAQMKEQNAVTLVVVDDKNTIRGVVSLGDIAASNMDVYDNHIVSKAATSYKNIVETLDGTVLCGDISRCFTQGKVTIAANTPDLMEEYIGEGDLVITGNRFESQFFAIELGVSCIVLCTNNVVNDTVIRMAEKKGCVIISSPYDSYTVARLINQSMPIEYFMTSKKLLTFGMEDYTQEVKDVMAKNRHRYFPVHDGEGHYLGQISKRSFLDMDKKKVILVDHNEKNQAVDGIEFADVVEIIDHHRLGNLETVNPVYFRNQPLGCTATIIHQMYGEHGQEISKEIAGILCSAIISDTLMFRSPTCTAVDVRAAENLAKIADLNIKTYAEEMFEAGSDLTSKTDEDIFYQDYKEFVFSGISFGIGQITSMNTIGLSQLKDRMHQFLSKHKETMKCENVIFMLTNILEESSVLLFQGNHAQQVIAIAYGKEVQEESIYVEGILSRKKQLVPDLINAVQQMEL